MRALVVLSTLALAACANGVSTTASLPSPPLVDAALQETPTSTRFVVASAALESDSPVPSAASPEVAAEPDSSAGTLPKGAVTTSMAKARVGNIEVVCGDVVSAVYAKSSRGSPTFLNLDREKGRFTIVIWREYRGLFNGAPDEVFRGRLVCIQGRITAFRGIPQIVSLGRDIAEPSRFLPLTGAARKCLANGANMSIYCTILVDEQRAQNDLYLDALDIQRDFEAHAYDDLDYPPDDYDYLTPDPDVP
jgi:hypothetical protein